ncbi:MAG: nucleotidyltransferase family protein [Armatimonadetes bacterium]|nr:nucleotidyltransferase family protein [Armatimonadota bacterium]
MDAIVTAGGRIDGAFARETGTIIKALLPIAGSTLLARALAALRGSARIRRICVVGPPEVEPTALAAGADRFVPERATGIDNLLLGIEALAAEGPVVCSASDLPFLSADAVEELIERTPADAGLTYVAVTRAEWEQAFPDSPHGFYVPLADGEFTGGCVHVQNAGALRRIEPLVQRAFAARKSQVAMARLLGAGPLLRLVAGFLVSRRLAPSSEGLCRRVEALAGCRCAVVRGCRPTLAADVDSLADWRYACRVAARVPAPGP